MLFKKRMNKKGIGVPISIVAYILLALLIIYIVLLIPIPAFTSLRNQINYWLIVAFFIVIQIGLVIAYFEIGKYAVKGFSLLRYKFININMDIRKYIISHA